MVTRSPAIAAANSAGSSNWTAAAVCEDAVDDDAVDTGLDCVIDAGMPEDMDEGMDDAACAGAVGPEVEQAAVTATTARVMTIMNRLMPTPSARPVTGARSC